MLKIGGVTPFSASDYPGKLAAVIFVQGCPLRCGYCHNPHLQARTADSPLDWTQVRDFLRRRTGLIDAVVFSGGEPTMDPALSEAIDQVRELGFLVGLHTSGCYPDRLMDILSKLDWVGLDIKAPFNDYLRITGSRESGSQALRCARAILESDIDYEFRTTIHPGLLGQNDLYAIADYLARMGAANYALQIFRPQGCLDKGLHMTVNPAYPGEEIIRHIAAMFPNFCLRDA